MFARMHVIETTAERHAVGLEIVRDEYLPWARETTGFRGLIGLADEGREKAIVISLWRDETALNESAGSGDQLSLLAAEATGSTRRSLESFEVTLFEVPQVRDPE